MTTIDLFLDKDRLNTGPRSDLYEEESEEEEVEEVVEEGSDIDDESLLEEIRPIQ